MSSASGWAKRLVWIGVWCLLCSFADCGLSSLRCSRRYYTHKALQTDMNGRRCWGDVKIMSCWGRCLSTEIADWQFPYKQSHHPVCVHGERRHATAHLHHCDPEVASGTELYHYVEAKYCKCQICSSEDTSCEWLPSDTDALSSLLVKEGIEEDME